MKTHTHPTICAIDDNLNSARKTSSKFPELNLLKNYLRSRLNVNNRAGELIRNVNCAYLCLQNVREKEIAMIVRNLRHKWIVATIELYCGWELRLDGVT